MFFHCGLSFRFTCFILLFVGLHLLTPSLKPIDCLAAEGRWEDPSQPANIPDPGYRNPKSPPPTAGQRFLGSIIGFYKKYIGPVDGSNCPSYPTCSQYSLEAIRKHGVLIGLVMTSDRLMHEYDEIRIAPLIKINNTRQVYDPVENNDFWWFDPREGQEGQ